MKIKLYVKTVCFGQHMWDAVDGTEQHKARPVYIVSNLDPFPHYDPSHHYTLKVKIDTDIFTSLTYTATQRMSDAARCYALLIYVSSQVIKEQFQVVFWTNDEWI